MEFTFRPTMKVLLTTIALAMIFYVQGRKEDCAPVACELKDAFFDCAAACGGSGAAGPDAAYAVSWMFCMVGPG